MTAPFRAAIMMLGLASAGCHSMTTNAATTGIHKGPEFRSHTFGAYCYNTAACRVTYAKRHDIESDTATGTRPDGASQKQLWTGHHIVMTAPQTVQVEWRSKDGTPLHADIDLGRVFADGRVVHRVPEDEIAPGVTITDPAVILVVDDRAIEVYMRAMIPLKQARDPANRYSDSVYEPVLVSRTTY